MTSNQTERKVWVAPQFTRLGAMRDVAKLTGGEGGGGGKGTQLPS